MSAALRPVAFVGDAHEAAGFALAGVATCVVQAGDAATAFERARAAAQVVLVSTACATRLPAATLERALAAAAPLTLVVTGEDGAAWALDPVARARRQLGLDP